MNGRGGGSGGGGDAEGGEATVVTRRRRGDKKKGMRSEGKIERWTRLIERDDDDDKRVSTLG